MYGYQFTEEFKELYAIGWELHADYGREINRLQINIKKESVKDRQKFCLMLGRILTMNDVSMRCIDNKGIYHIRIFNEIEEHISIREMKIANVLTKYMQQMKLLPLKK